jgi:hypothetical protein
MQELVADALVHADALGDLLHVGADLLAEVGDLVDEGDLHGEEGVGGVFDQLGGAAFAEIERRLVEIERAVDLAHDLDGARLLGAEHDAVGALEVGDGGAFAQEFRVGDDRDVLVRELVAEDALDLVAGADGNRRFGDDDGEAGRQRGDFTRGGIDIGEVGMAVAAARRRADGDEDDVGGGDRGGEILGEIQASGARFCAMMVSRPGSKIGTSPRSSASILASDLSTQVT